ncbi:hypothetical protein [Agrobacterium sp. LMR679]|uniref:hypothetical protein n=1 Tax=Agrobacterium sp. LMR679 TaxID=3014335 RepID=UPI0022AFB3D1|nr:hypothetical protein [Agrobacterium sp. LMR679]MCZ4073572.1 hypothetical protein [Agrobacterium sp. LMR679]MCZ4076284.1 hypothetical protein [Agrobacterium sp. LMR679]
MNQKMQLSDWKVDNSAGRPILTYKGCSVIEAEDAEFALSAIHRALEATPAQNVRDLIVEVLRDHHEVKRIGALADRLEAALSAAKPEPTIPYAIWKFIAIEVDIEPREPATQVECRHDLDKLEFHLQTLIKAYPTFANLAPYNNDLRMWFVAELTKVASGRIPLTEIEALVDRKLTAVKGGEA